MLRPPSALLPASLALLASAATLPAQVPDGLAAKIRAEGIDNSHAMDFLGRLTRDIGHRLSGSENLVKAAHWAQAEFERMGLVARLEQWDEWPQAWNREQWSGRVTAPEALELQVATEAWTAGTSGRQAGPLRALPADPDELDPEVVRGAWLFDMGSVPSYDEEGGGRGRGRGRGRRGAASALEARAQELGALGIVRSSQGDGRHPNRIRVFGNHNTARLPTDSLPTMPEVVVRYDQAVQLRDWLQAGTAVEIEFDIRNRFTPGPIPLFNVIAELVGSDRPDEYVYVCGHLDSWHQATGTTDNGTGTCSTLEAARILCAVGAKPRRTIRFALWGGEEQGLLGSREHVRMHRTDMERVSAVFNHDTGTNWAAGLGVTAAMEEDMRRVFSPVMALSAPDADHDGDVFALRVVNGLSGGGSDHASFLAAGVPGLNWSLEGRSDYFGYTWHSQWDTYDVAIPEYQAHTSTVIALAALGTANLPHLLSREGLRREGGGRGRRGDATTFLQGYLGAEFDGLKVTAVEKDGVCDKSGVRVGDVIVAVNGQEVTALIDVFRRGRDAGFDSPLELTLQRGEDKVKVTLKMEDR